MFSTLKCTNVREPRRTGINRVSAEFRKISWKCQTLQLGSKFFLGKLWSLVITAIFFICTLYRSYSEIISSYFPHFHADIWHLLASILHLNFVYFRYTYQLLFYFHFLYLCSLFCWSERCRLFCLKCYCCVSKF